MSLEKIAAMQEVFSAMKSLTDNISSVNAGQLADAVSNVGNTYEQDISVSFELPNVTSYEEFVTKAQSDTRFEKIVQQMTLGTLAGQNSLKKYRY